MCAVKGVEAAPHLSQGHRARPKRRSHWSPIRCQNPLGSAPDCPRSPPRPHTSSLRKPALSAVARRALDQEPRPCCAPARRPNTTAESVQRAGGGAETGTPGGAVDPTGCRGGSSALRNRQRERGSGQGRRPGGRHQGGAEGGGPEDLAGITGQIPFWKGDVEQDLGQLSHQALDPPGGGLLRPQEPV